MTKSKVFRYFWYILTLSVHSITLAFSIITESIVFSIIMLSLLTYDCIFFKEPSNRKCYVEYFQYTLMIVVLVLFNPYGW